MIGCEAEEAGGRAPTLEQWKARTPAVQQRAYHQPKFRLTYIQSFFEKTFDELSAMLASSIAHDPHRRTSSSAALLQFLQDRAHAGPIKIICMGCGPAAEVVALMHFLRQLLPLACPNQDPNSITIDITLVDVVAGWKGAPSRPCKLSCETATGYPSWQALGATQRSRDAR
jgi:hypothetical protein